LQSYKKFLKQQAIPRHSQPPATTLAPCSLSSLTFAPNFKNNRLSMKRKSILKRLLLLTMIGVTQFSIAQGNGVGGINEATRMVTSYFDPATKLIYAIGAVVGLIGGVKVYNKFSSGDPDTSKTAASWFGACIFLIVAATILRSFFL